MSDVAVEVNHVWKKFHRGELHDSLRDLIPALAKRAIGRGPKRDELAKDDFWALRDVSFQVKHGEVLGIIGPNGAGKSTLLKILAKIIKPTKGSVRVNGRLRALIEVAAGFHGDLTGRENIYLNGTILGMKKREIDAKFDEIVDFSGIAPFLDTPVKRYSSGMYARLGFAVAAHLEPEVLIIDEVLAVGDAEFQRKCFGKLGAVAQEGRTVLFVSHNMQAINTLSTRAILLNHGQIGSSGEPRAVVDDYLRIAANGDSEITERCWELARAPGDCLTRLSAVRVLDEKCGGCYYHDIARPVLVELDVAVLQPHPDVSVSFHVFNQEGVCLFVTGRRLDPPVPNSLLPPGLYRATCQVPGNYLNDGPHWVSAFIVQNTTQIVAQIPRVVSFYVQDYGQTRDGYLGRVIGAVRPVLPWTTKRTGDLP